jgi:leader peptidase (prepilin peptidase) / N-methyltransferase
MSGPASAVPRRAAVAAVAAGWRWAAAALLVTPVLRWLVLVHAVPAGQPWRAGCPHCDTPLAPGRDLAPLLPAARCGGCRRRIGAPPFALEAAALAVAGLVVVSARGGAPLPVVALAGWAAVSVALTFIDLAVHRLPDRLTLPVAGWVVLVLGLAALVSGGPWVRSVLAGLACGGGFLLMTLVAGDAAFGLGDAKLALSIGVLLGWLGWTAVVLGLAVAFLSGGLVAAALLLTRRVGRRDALPFGPYLVLGTLAVLAWLPAT